MPLLLMALILALSITSFPVSGTYECYWCELVDTVDCGIPLNKSSTDPQVGDCSGSLCAMRIWKEDGRFMIYLLLFTCYLFRCVLNDFFFESILNFIVFEFCAAKAG